MESQDNFKEVRIKGTVYRIQKFHVKDALYFLDDLKTHINVVFAGHETRPDMLFSFIKGISFVGLYNFAAMTFPNYVTINGNKILGEEHILQLFEFKKEDMMYIIQEVIAFNYSGFFLDLHNMLEKNLEKIMGVFLEPNMKNQAGDKLSSILSEQT